jgi:hypothetical protein
MSLHPTIAAVTDRIRARSEGPRAKYMQTMARAAAEGPRRAHLTCGNQAHAYAAMGQDKDALVAERSPNLGIITSYNDMLSAHQPFERFPDLIRQAARAVGATAQVAGGVPAMCDGVTQGQTGMELSLFSRDVIALSAAVGLSHNTYDAALYLGRLRQDRARPRHRRRHLRLYPRAVPARRPHDFRPAQRRKGQGPPEVRHRRSRPRRADEIRNGQLPRPRHLHLLWHRQHQPDADGVHGAPSARRLLRQPQHADARRADRGGDRAGGGDHRLGQRIHPGLRHPRRTGLRERPRRPHGHGWLDQPRHPPARHGAGGGDHPRPSGFRRHQRGSRR